MDPRQILGAVMTFIMFVMLGNMIKKDHFDPPQVTVPETSDVPFDEVKFEEKSVATTSRVSSGPWKEDGQALRPCWTTPKPKETEDAGGFITFALSGGPEYYISQVANAVVIAKYLGATLVVPHIRRSNPGEKRKFQEIYDVKKFLKSLDGVVSVAEEEPADIASKTPVIVRVPNRVTEDYIVEHVEPKFRTKGYLRLSTVFPSVNMKIRETEKKEFDSVACLGMFGTLELQPEVQEVVDSMIERLRTLSRRSDGRFIAVDLRVDILEKKGCNAENTVTKSCFDGQEIGEFLKKIGFDSDTIIYLTHSRWDDRLDALKNIFPKTYTKEGIIPADKKSKFLHSECPELEKTLDFYICSQSDVFVPAISGLFYANVAGRRIASGRNQILVPAQISASSASASDYISHYVSNKNHLAYSCFC